MALLARSWVLALAALPVLAAFGAGFARALAPAPRIEARAEGAPERALAGDEADVRIVARNPGPRMGLAELALDKHPFVAIESGAPLALVVLPGQGEAALNVRVGFPMRGRVPLGELVARERSLFGVLAREARVPLEARTTVLPKWERLSELRWLSRRARVLPAGMSMTRPGAGEEFYALRQYLPGDPIDSVNWKQTAKLGRPIVNEHELETPADVVLALDARQSVHAGAGYHASFEACVRAVTSLSERAAASRAKVSLLVVGGRLDWIHPGTGRRQHEKIVERLLDAFPAGAYELAAALPILPPTVLPRGATLVLVTTADGDPTLPFAVEQLVARGLRAVVVACSPEASEVASGLLRPRGEAAARVLALERRRWHDALRARGADVIEWDPREPLAHALALLEARR